MPLSVANNASFVANDASFDANDASFVAKDASFNKKRKIKFRPWNENILLVIKMKYFFLVIKIIVVLCVFKNHLI